MIFDNMKNCKTYYGVHPNFEKAFAFIQKVMDENLEVGKYEIDGKDVFASVQRYESKLKENSGFEGHQNYIDIQCILDGREIMGCVEIDNAVVRKEYNPDNDAAFFEKNELATYCIAGKGDFCVFYPNDIHSPGVAYNDVPAEIKKVVVKVRV